MRRLQPSRGASGPAPSLLLLLHLLHLCRLSGSRLEKVLGQRLARPACRRRVCRPLDGEARRATRTQGAVSMSPWRSPGGEPVAWNATGPPGGGHGLRQGCDCRPAFQETTSRKQGLSLDWRRSAPFHGWIGADQRHSFWRRPGEDHLRRQEQATHIMDGVATGSHQTDAEESQLRHASHGPDSIYQFHQLCASHGLRQREADAACGPQLKSSSPPEG